MAERSVCPVCRARPRRQHGGYCTPCSTDHARERRRRLTPQEWPCVQCWQPIRWSGGKGGNRLTICRECAPDSATRSLVRRYGVDRHMFDAMYFDQDGKCAVESCRREAVVVDHCHTTGRVRGLLCRGCNAAIGFVEDDRWMAGVHEYLGEAQ